MRLATTALFLLCAAPALAADDPYKVKFLLGAGYEASSIDFSQSQTIPQFQENATINTSYGADKAPGFDAAIQWNAFKHVGLQGALSRYSRDLSGSFQASFPHPLYFDQPRTASGTVKGTLSETAAHLCVVAYGHSGSFDLSAWAGVAFIKVEGDLLQDVTYSQSYPFDSVTVTGTPTAKVSDSPIGVSAGASVDWRFAKSVGVGVQGRFAKATAKLVTPQNGTANVDAGGFAVGIGLRLYF